MLSGVNAHRHSRTNLNVLPLNNRLIFNGDCEAAFTKASTVSRRQNGFLLPLEATFWAIRFAMLVDRFGVAWMVNCKKDG
ncbi:hypothetical protein A1D17_01675 [Pseudomonas fluorescens]|uniref:PhnB-like domain-containing protein n=1 Tax=Pseudomonas fluorescens TaxID=294 RepID=A0A166R1K2_PSEFL|nr:hypothetical protein A1D17_01675 [Pseudomonas fluorescens]